MAVVTKSLREALSESIGSFLFSESFAPGDKITQSGILEIINLISDYQEEGIPLFPEVLITNNLDFFDTIPNHEIVIQEGELSVDEFKKAIKLCAPLAINGWIIFIEVKDNRIKYGIASAEMSETSPSIYSQTVGDLKVAEYKGSTIAYIRNVGQKTVELSGLKGSVVVSLSLDETNPISTNEIEVLCNAITKDCNDKYKNNIKAYFSKLISAALQVGHGNLIGVVEDNEESIKELKAKINVNGGVYLPVPIDFEQLIYDLETERSLDANNAVKVHSDILKSMLNHDGITIMTNKGKVLAYHILISDYINEGDVINGGARSKAFKSMENCGIFSCCFYKSQDGNAKIWKKYMSELQIWQGPNGLKFPPSVQRAEDVVPYANLTEKQKSQIISAFQIEAYDMAAEYAWKKAMVKLKETIGTLGMKFVGEMLGRPDFDETTNPDSVITDHSAIELSEQLGVINSTAALKLRQSNELITHFFSKNASEELDYASAFTIVKSSVQYILSENDISIAIEFTRFRERLLNESLRLSDPQIQQLLGSPLFYLRTVISILLTTIKNDTGAKLENSLGNLNMLLPDMWDNLAETDKWNIGFAYRDVTAAGNTTAVAGLKNALLKVNGFDFVPENLRSVTFIQLAKQILDVHYKYDNFYNEPPLVRKLSQLGNTIPAPALSFCFQAYLAVYLGNSYGVSHSAAAIAEVELSEINEERWYYYFDKIIQSDDVVLSKIQGGRIDRFSDLLNGFGLNSFIDLPKINQDLYIAIVEKKRTRAQNVARDLLAKIKPK